MATKTGVANIAMGLLGQSLFSDVDTDGGVQAGWINEFWDGSRDESQRAYTWNFGIRRTLLVSEPGEKDNPKGFAINAMIWADELSLWVAVGAADGTDAYILTSPDKITWTERANPKNFALNGIAFDGTTLVAVGAADGTDAYIVTSTDGITWTERAPAAGDFTLNSVVWCAGLGLFIAVGESDGTNSEIYTSPDGTTWTERQPTVDIDADLYDIAWTGSRAVAVGAPDATRPYVAYSTDGLTWTQATDGLALVLALNGVIWSGTRLVAVGAATTSNGPYTVTSDDGGVTWDVRSNISKALALNKIAYGNGFYVAVGVADTVSPDNKDTFVVSSKDGVNWGERILGKNVTLNGITFGNGSFVMGGDSDGDDAYLLAWGGPPAYGPGFSYDLPSEYLRMYDVSDGQEMDYKIEQGSLHVNSSPSVEIKYAERITDPLKFDPLYARALGVQLAKDSCIAITKSDSRMEMLGREWQKALSSARTMDSQEDGDDRETTDEWIRARRQGNYTSGWRWR